MRLKLMKNEKIVIKRGLIFIVFLFSLFSFLFCISCSSAPKKAAEIFTDRILSANQLNMANQIANQGHYEDALLMLAEARRLALSSDDPSLRIKTSMSRGNILFSLGRHDEAFAEWKSAATEGDSSGEPALAALARIYAIRAELVLLANETGGSGADAAAERYKIRIAEEMVLVKSDPLSTAAGNVTMGMADKQLGRWTEAESSVKKALDYHDKDRYLEDAAYDWFLIASIRSVSGNYTSALEALRMAISYDRRAENGFGLASSWQAMGEVYKKAGQPEESNAAFRRAVDIYRAINLPDRALQLEAQL